MTHNEQRKKALKVLDLITDWEEYKSVIAAFTTVDIFTEFEMKMIALDKYIELEKKGLI